MNVNEAFSKNLYASQEVGRASAMKAGADALLRTLTTFGKDQMPVLTFT